jgi:type IV secretory pathway TraG/TraD family ATPase VirD4
MYTQCQWTSEFDCTILGLKDSSLNIWYMELCCWETLRALSACTLKGYFELWYILMASKIIQFRSLHEFWINKYAKAYLMTYWHSLRICTSLLIKLYAPNMSALRQSVFVLIIYIFVSLILRYKYLGNQQLIITHDSSNIPN